MVLALSALTGLMVGSFLNVVAHRLPRGEGLAFPPSRCPGCEAPIKPYDNVPVLSWLLLRGRCRSCRGRIAARYPLVEAMSAVLAAAVVWAKGLDADAVLPLVLLALLVPVTLIDLEQRIIPNRITGFGAVAALVLGTALDPGGEPERLVAGLAAGGFLLAAVLAYPSGMGMGDVKLAGMLGLFLGREVAVALLVALVAGTVVGLAVMARLGVREGRRTAVPFGPFLALGGAVAIFAGEALMGAYLDTFS